jgi:site-specific DNA recombinase
MTRHEKKTVRCAIYTRKSSEEGLDLDFNSLDAQRESAEAYIKSQAHEGWVCLPQRYDDGGFTGGNMERPGVQKLLADIEAGRVDCVVVYKVDRLSRSLLDFARIMDTFDSQNVSFVSVTQQFNTTHSMGRLTLNILLSFAQFEREIIGERIRDKIAAQKRKGKWAGGTPVLGYDVDRSAASPKLVVNTAEATRVRDVFELYLQLGSLLPVVRELRSRGWLNKKWFTKAGEPRGGDPFHKGSLHALLTNPLYVGRIKHKEQTFAGEHESLVDRATWEQVQTLLGANGRNGGVLVRNKHGALLKQLLWCSACGRHMTYTFTRKKERLYRYYTCTNAISAGYDRCPAPSLPAAEVEKVVVDQVRAVTRDPALRDGVLQRVRELAAEEHDEARAEAKQADAEIRRCEAEIRKLSTAKRQNADQLASLHDQVRAATTRLQAARAELGDQVATFGADELTAVFADFDAVWGSLSPKEQGELVRLLVAKVEFDAETSEVSVTFHDRGLAAPRKASA